MRRYQKWLSMGLLTLTPHLALADELDTPAGNAAPTAAVAPNKKSSANQELAERVAKSLRKAQLNQYEIDIDVRSGVVTLVGKIAKPDQKAAAEKAVSSVAGVTRVINRLEVTGNDAKGAVQQAAASMPRSPARSSQYVRQTNGARPPYAGIEPDESQQPIGPPANMQGIPSQYGEPPRVAFAGAAPAPLAPVPQSGPPAAYPQSMGGNAVYNQPNLPNNSWPTYAQSPNYAGVSYPSQYSASAFPYIGPFYPYPQVPLGWRKASLEWDDGYWNLNFKSRTDRWWWFMNPQNW
jgi:hypothetical protein